MSSRKVGRKHKLCANSPPNQNSLFKFFKHDKGTSESIVSPIIKGLVSNVIARVETEDESKLKKKHHAAVSSKTIESWKLEFPWLDVIGTDEDMIMKCKVCIQSKVPSIWSQEGSCNFQKTSVSRHDISTEHEKAAEKCGQYLEKDKNVCLSDSSDEQPETGEIKLFRTVFYAAKEGLPTSQVNNLLELQRLNGVDIKYKNLSWDTLSEMQSCIKTELQREIISDITKSEFFAVMLDESTDLAVEKHLSICVKYVKYGEPVTKFLTNISVEDGKAHTIVNHLIQTIIKFELDPSRMVSLATDGAATMMGHKSGVGVQMKAKYSPFMVQTHCIAHRLNLAVSDSIKHNTELVTFREKFNSLYIFMSSSSSRVLKLKKMQEILNEPELSLKEPHGIRWLGLKHAVEAVYESYGSVLLTLSAFAAEKNSQAHGLYKYFVRYKTVMLVAFMLDAHEIVASLSLSMQKENIGFSEIQPLIDGTVEKLNSIKTKDGDSLQEMKTRVEFKAEDEKMSAYMNEEKLTYYSEQIDTQLSNLRENYVTSLQKNIRHRFRKSDSEIFTNLSVLLEPDVQNAAENEEVEDAPRSIAELYGEGKTTKVTKDDHVEENQLAPLLDRNKLEKEWPLLKGMLKGSYKDKQTQTVCKRVLTVHKEVMPEIAKLCKIAMSIAVSSVVCERSFSHQNRIKTKYRSSLKEESLDNLMQIQMCGCDFTTYDPEAAVKSWYREKKRRKGRLIQQYKPRSSGSAKGKCP